MKEHGFKVAISRIDEFFLLTVTINGKLRHSDYEIMVPMLEKAVKEVNTPKLKVLVDGTNLDGWELEAAFDDLKLGIEFNNNFEKIAYIGTKSWEKYGMKIANWFTGYEMKFFENRHSAYSWLIQDIPRNTPTQKDLNSRADDITDDIRELFEKHLKITDWNVPETDDENASNILLDLFEAEIQNIKHDIKNKKYD